MQKKYNNINYLIYICNTHKLITIYNIRNAQYSSIYNHILDQKSFNNNDH